MTNLVRSSFQAHPFHLVSPSPWPIITCLTLFAITTSGVSTMHIFYSSVSLFNVAFVALVCSMSLWFRDIINEATYLGNHTSAVQKGLNIGVALFIVSEALFFFAIFWTFLHSALSPPGEAGTQWPPNGIDSVDPFELPVLNTLLLLASGIAVTCAHHSIVHHNRTGASYNLALTVVLALAFTCYQGVEYISSSFTLSDSTFGSCFYFGTGFHGLHVIIGTAFIAVGLWRLLAYHFTENHYLGLESSILYWHFVDVVWLFLFISVYYWGS